MGAGRGSSCMAKARLAAIEVQLDRRQPDSAPRGSSLALLQGGKDLWNRVNCCGAVRRARAAVRVVRTAMAEFPRDAPRRSRARRPGGASLRPVTVAVRYASHYCSAPEHATPGLLSVSGRTMPRSLNPLIAYEGKGWHRAGSSPGGAHTPPAKGDLLDHKIEILYPSPICDHWPTISRSKKSINACSSYPVA